MSGLYGNRLLNATNILYDITLEQEYQRTYREFNLMMNDSYVLESNMSDKVNIIINKIKELWNKFKEWAKECFKKIREFIKKLLKIKPKDNNTNNKQDKESYEEYKKRTNIKISYYDLGYNGINIEMVASTLLGFSSHSYYILNYPYKNFDEKDDINKYYEEITKECIDESDKKFKEHKKRITLSDDDIEYIEHNTSYDKISDYIKDISYQINRMSDYITDANKGLNKAEKEIEEYEKDLIRLLKRSTDDKYSERYRISRKYEAKMIQHDIPLFKEHVVIFVNNIKFIGEKYQYNIKEYNRLNSMINFAKNPKENDSNILKLTDNNKDGIIDI